MKLFGIEKLPFKRMLLIITIATFFFGAVNSLSGSRLWFNPTAINVVFVYSLTITFFCFWFTDSIKTDVFERSKLLYYSSVFARVIAGTILALLISNLILFGKAAVNIPGVVITFAGTIIITVIVSGYEILRHRLENKISELKEAEIENERMKRFETEARLNSLQAKLNPHFLFNTLNTTASLIYEDRKKAEENIIRLSNLYRKVLNISNQTFIPISREIELLEDYLELEKTRFEEKLFYDIKCEEDLRDIKIPGLLLEPLAENAIKHCQDKSAETIKIEICVEKINNDLFMSVTDNGPGFNPEKTDWGFGLYSIQERLKLLYSDGYELNICSDKEEGTKIVIKIPLKTKTE